MIHSDRETDRRSDDRRSGERRSAPPIEREHETQAGVFDEDERRERERRTWNEDPDAA